MKRPPVQTVLPFGRKEAVLNRQIRERAAGKKVSRGLGRPPLKNGRVPHLTRAGLGENTAVHVTLRTREIVPTLRTRRRFNVVKRAFVTFCGGEQPGRAAAGFRLIHFAVLSNHVHFVVEADSKRALSLGMQKLLHSISRRLNSLFVHERGGRVSTKGGAFRALPGWVGKLFTDRYHAHLLPTPTQMARAVRYVLQNADRHGASRPDAHGTSIDAFTSLGALTDDLPQPERPLVAGAKGFLLKRACRRFMRAWLR